MINSPRYRFFLIGILALLFGACNSTKLVPEGKYLLNKTKLHIDDKKIDEDELDAIIKQHPNRRILWTLRFHLGVYNYASRKLGKKETKFRNWLKNTIGEEPVIYDRQFTKKSTHQLNLFLKNKGYFNSTVKDSAFFEKKKAKVHYYIKGGEPYRIRKITFSIADTALIKPIRIASRRTLMKPGNNYDVNVITKERQRMAEAMKNQGYYDFSKEYIYFEVDSALNRHKLDLKLVIKNPLMKAVDSLGNDTLIGGTHQLYFIRNIYVNTWYKPSAPDEPLDTLVVDGYYFLYRSSIQIKPEVLIKNIFIKEGNLYSLRNEKYTYSRLAALKLFKFISIRHHFADDGSSDSYRNHNQLDCYINLTPSPRQSFAIETEGTNRSGNLGVSGSMVYKNKNTFKGAEVLEVKFGGGLEAQKIQSTSEDKLLGEGPDNLSKATPFNTLELGPEVSLYIPKLWLPRKLSKLPRHRSPKTTFTGRYSFQQRPDYTRDIATISYGYSWKGSKYHSHIFTPVDVSLVKIDIRDTVFQNYLEASNNTFLKNSYESQVIVSSRYSFIFSNQDLNKSRNFLYLRANIEGAGNFLRMTNNLFGTSQQADGSYHFFKVQYAQYLKSDVDLRIYNVLNKRTNVVYRLYAGTGVPMTNLNSMPFVKSFFGGGANGLRAWEARTLGPGSFLNDTLPVAIDQIGDVKFEANIEYRFDIMKILEGAFFADIGNIWMLKEDPRRPGGDFKFNRFYKELAVGAGLGARFDFSFFIIRLDAALPIRDPKLPRGERWLLQPKDSYDEIMRLQNELEKAGLYTEFYNAPGVSEKSLKWKEIWLKQKTIDQQSYRYSPRVVFNFGIGYPF